MSEFITNLKKARSLRRITAALLRKSSGASWWTDEGYIRARYFCAFYRRLNLSNPQTFSEKLQWLKLNDKHEEYTQLVDKHSVKEYLKSIGGGETINTHYCCLQ